MINKIKYLLFKNKLKQLGLREVKVNVNGVIAFSLGLE